MLLEDKLIAMTDIYINKLAADNANWLSVRQSLVAGNIANANTPGFKALDVKSMDVSGQRFSNLVATNTKHIIPNASNVGGVAIENGTPWEIYYSGGNVSLPQEMLKASEVSTAFQLNTSVMKSFHRMVISVFGT